MRQRKNVALKTALFSTGVEQQEICRVARVSPQDLSHVIAGRRSFDQQEQKRLVKALARYGVSTTVDQLFPCQTEAA